jgi:hypothetical protein
MTLSPVQLSASVAETYVIIGTRSRRRMKLSLLSCKQLANRSASITSIEASAHSNRSRVDQILIDGAVQGSREEHPQVAGPTNAGTTIAHRKGGEFDVIRERR